MGPLGELGALFNPGMRHEIEERESKANRREEEGNARDGDLRIDLASGVAVINIPGRPVGGGKTERNAKDRQTPDDGTTGAPATAREDGPAAGGRTAQSGSESESDTSGPELESAAARTAKSSRKHALTTGRRAGARTSSGRPSVTRGERADSASEEPTNGRVPSSKASRAAR